ncbi:hypothetical protein RB199_10960 [Streptomyces libani]|uniref:hypothetical protein n=1 Tax=Streptomyces sp. G7(2002) TaxID=2971798 RepID=UPI00237D3EF4|nr:hypothetical protein [Streptomyces sp. G7(2002)]WDT58588.1 hypothetical protein NUT86_33740 [Streptomyces sp. G7(2002)]
MKRTTLPRSAEGVRWEGLALGVDGPARPPLRAEVGDGRRLVLLQGDQVVLLARQRVTHRGVHYARTGRYTSPIPPLRAETARTYREVCPDDDAWFARWAHHFASALRESGNGPLHEGDWHLRPGMSPYAVDAYWETLAQHDPDRGHIAWFCGSPAHDSRDLLPLRPLSAPDAPRVKACRRQYREGVLPPVVLWGISALDTSVVLDGHDRLAAALAEGGRPPVLRLNRAGLPELHALLAQPDLRAYEERIASLQRQRDAGDPLAPYKIANEGRRLAQLLHEAHSGGHLTRGWPLPGGSPAWDALARRHAPGWHPDTEN